MPKVKPGLQAKRPIETSDDELASLPIAAKKARKPQTKESKAKEPKESTPKQPRTKKKEIVRETPPESITKQPINRKKEIVKETVSETATNKPVNRKKEVVKETVSETKQPINKKKENIRKSNAAHSPMSDKDPKQVLSFEMTRELTMELAKLKDSQQELQSQLKAAHQQMLKKMEKEHQTYRKEMDKKLEEYETIVSTLTVRNERLEKELEQLKSNQLDVINGSTPHVSQVEELDAKLKQMEQQLKDKEEEIQFLDKQVSLHEQMLKKEEQASVLVVDAEKQRQLVAQVEELNRQLAEKNCTIAKLESQPKQDLEEQYVFKLERMVRLYEHMSGIIVQSVVEEHDSPIETQDPELRPFAHRIVFKCLHKGDRNSLMYYLITPKDHVSDLYIFKYIHDNHSEKLPDYLQGEIIFKSTEVFFKKVFEWIMT